MMKTDMQILKKGAGRVASSLLLIGIIIASIFPFLYMFLMSFKSTINAHDLDFSLEKLSLMQYQKIFAMDHFGRYIFNSVFVAAAGVILTVGVCSLAGYAFAKMDFKGNDKIFLFLVMTMVVPSEVIIIPLFLITKGLGWLNTYRALILPLPTAFGVFIMRQAILDVPQDLIDAAKIDGCGNLKIFFKVVLPLVKSSMLALSIFTFVGAWNNFLWPLVASTKTEMKTLPLALSMMKTQFNTDVGLTMACAVINFLPPFIFYVFIQGRFKEGMTLSGMKG
jgi:multiple sugar transport system permease protein